MLHCWTSLLCAAVACAGCTMPYGPPVLVYGGAPFQGIAGLIEQDGSKQVDVLLVHGMCTHTREHAKAAIGNLAAALDQNILPELPRAALLPDEVDGIQIETRTFQIGKGRVRFTALVWSPLTQALKQQLTYDRTDKPSDCAAPGDCKPIRASINGKLKDGLLNDCLADALIYQGDSRPAIRQKMANAITQVIEDSQAQALAAGLAPGSFALVSDSLGSKISFDALDEMTGPKVPANQRAAAESAVDRLAIIFIQANQMPILGLADQSIDTEGRQSTQQPAGQDSLQRLLLRKSAKSSAGAAARGDGVSRLALVAFTDPNDLLSYRLLPSRYTVPGIDVADMLVSNDSTYFGTLELPNTAHTDYPKNKNVTRLIACGSAGSVLCK